MTELDKLLTKIDLIARNKDPWELGLPVYYEEAMDEIKKEINSYVKVLKEKESKLIEIK